MKTIFFAGLVALSLFLVACGPNLPPEPGAPGTVAGGALAGKAVERMAEFFTLDAPAEIVKLDGRFLRGPGIEDAPFVVPSEGTLEIIFGAGELLCFPTGYHASDVNPDAGWLPFDFSVTERIGSGGWAPCGSGISASIDVSELSVGMNGLVVYSCRTKEDCYRNKWRLTLVERQEAEPVITEEDACTARGWSWIEVTVGEFDCLPPTPEAPPSDGTPS